MDTEKIFDEKNRATMNIPEKQFIPKEFSTMNPLDPTAQEKSEEYMEIYNEFLNDYQKMEMSGEQIGLMMARLAQYYSYYNLKLSKAMRGLSAISKDVGSRVDASGKALSVAKIKAEVETSEAYLEYDSIKNHIKNIEQYISALRALQKGVLKEFDYMGNS